MPWMPGNANRPKRKIPAVFGTMSIPEPLGAADAKEALEYFLAAGFNEIDTAILYQDGKTEETLGACELQTTNALSGLLHFLLADGILEK